MQDKISGETKAKNALPKKMFKTDKESYVHYDEYNSLETGSAELIIEKAK